MWALNEIRLMKEKNVSIKNCKNANSNKVKNEYCKSKKASSEMKRIYWKETMQMWKIAQPESKKLWNIASSKEMSLKILQDYWKKIRMLEIL